MHHCTTQTAGFAKLGYIELFALEHNFLAVIGDLSDFERFCKSLNTGGRVCGMVLVSQATFDIFSAVMLS